MTQTIHDRMNDTDYKLENLFAKLNPGRPSCNERFGLDLDSIKSQPSILFSMDQILFRAYPFVDLISAYHLGLNGSY
jgi:hypothetical protein